MKWTESQEKKPQNSKWSGTKSIQLEAYDEMWFIKNLAHYSCLIWRQWTFYLSEKKTTAMKIHPW